MKKVKLLVFGSERFSGATNSFFHYLIDKLNEQRDESKSNVQHLLNLVKERDVEEIKCLDIFSEFSDNITMDFDFAKQLQINDMLYFECFKSSSGVGRELLACFSEFEDLFLITSKVWESSTLLCLSIDWMHTDYEYHARESIMDGTYYQREKN